MAVTQRDAHLNRTGLWRLKQRVTKRISIDVSQKMLMASQFRIRNGKTNAHITRTGTRDQKMNLLPLNNVFPNLLIRFNRHLSLRFRGSPTQLTKEARLQASPLMRLFRRLVATRLFGYPHLFHQSRQISREQTLRDLLENILG